MQAAEGDGPYSQLFSYLSVRNRCGVVSSWGSQIKDLYIIPLAASSPIPSALLPFSGPGKSNVHILNVNSGEYRGHVLIVLLRNREIPYRYLNSLLNGRDEEE